MLAEAKALCDQFEQVNNEIFKWSRTLPTTSSTGSRQARIRTQSAS
jgi:hypothetical protein